MILSDYPDDIRTVLAWAAGNGWSLRQVSRFSGIPERTLQNWYEGSRRPPQYLSRLLGRALSDALGPFVLIV